MRQSHRLVLLLLSASTARAQNCAACDDVPLSWAGHTIFENNLAGNGNIRYGNIGTYNGRSLDMVIARTTGTPLPDCTGTAGGGNECDAQGANYYGGSALTSQIAAWPSC
jgi:hypothetical protein